jgi:alkanesulfonate monooxygenase SsuD/methylene tetrahydromethanopterin reductase-like flavin-dependent oxidoreductase (luciferase family)
VTDPAPPEDRGDLPTAVTGDVAGARGWIAQRLGMAADLPSYRAMLEVEGVAGAVAVAGDEQAVERQIHRFADAGATDCVAVPFASPDQVTRTLHVLAELYARVGS